MARFPKYNFTLLSVQSIYLMWCYFFISWMTFKIKNLPSEQMI